MRADGTRRSGAYAGHRGRRLRRAEPWTDGLLAVFEIVRERPACFAFRYEWGDRIRLTDRAGLAFNASARSRPVTRLGLVSGVRPGREASFGILGVRRNGSS